MQRYNKVNWQNKPITQTPINSTNLNHMDDQIYVLSTDKADLSDVPTLLSELTNDMQYQTLSQTQTLIENAISALGTLLVFRGVVANYTALTSISNPKNGDVYKVTNDSDASTPHGANSEYYYLNNAWNYYGSDFEVALDNYYTKSETNTLLNSKVSSGTILAIKQENGLFYYTTDNSTWTVVKSGDNGATFIPSVDNDGYISWSNDKMLPNPATKNIKGQKGDTGYAPQVSVQENTQTSYKLAITYGANGESTLVTPNLKGQDGTGVGDMLMSVYDTNEDGVVNEADKVSNALTITQNGVSTTYDGSSAVSIDVKGGSHTASAERTIYISANGNDENDGLTTSTPMATIDAIIEKYGDDIMNVRRQGSDTVTITFGKPKYEGIYLTIYSCSIGYDGNGVPPTRTLINCNFVFNSCAVNNVPLNVYNSTITVTACSTNRYTKKLQAVLNNSIIYLKDCENFRLACTLYSSHANIDGGTYICPTSDTLVYCDGNSTVYFTNNPTVDAGRKLYGGNGVANLKESFTTLSKSITIATSDWASDATYTDYPYRVSITWSGITTSHKVDVNFNGANLGNAGDVASFTETYNGGFYMYASATPSASLTAQATATKVEVV